jgi:hypothetical protein
LEVAAKGVIYFQNKQPESWQPFTLEKQQSQGVTRSHKVENDGNIGHQMKGHEPS